MSNSTLDKVKFEGKEDGVRKKKKEKRKEKKNKRENGRREDVGSRQVSPAGCCCVLAGGRCGGWYEKMRAAGGVGRLTPGGRVLAAGRLWGLI